jgi:amino acid permease
MKERNKNRDILGFRPYQIWAVCVFAILFLAFIVCLCFFQKNNNCQAIENTYLFLGVPIVILVIISYFEEIKKFFKRIF